MMRAPILGPGRLLVAVVIVLLTLMTLSGVALADLETPQLADAATTSDKPATTPDETSTTTPAGDSASAGEKEEPDGGDVSTGVSIVQRLWWLWAVAALGAGFVIGRSAADGDPGTVAPPRTGSAPGRAEHMGGAVRHVGTAGPGVAARPGGQIASATNASRPAGSMAPASQPPDRALVADLVLAHDLARDEAMTGHVEQVLGRLGVSIVAVAAGDPFDNSIHRAVSTEDADEGLDGPVVARVVRQGWEGPDGVVRRPEVVVISPPGDVTVPDSV